MKRIDMMMVLLRYYTETEPDLELRYKLTKKTGI